MGLFLSSISQYSGPWYEVARNLFRSRETQCQRAEQLQKQLTATQQALAKLQQEQAAATRHIQRLEQEGAAARTEVQQLKAQPLALPQELPLPYHTFGPKLISVCLELAKRVGLRASVDVLQIVLDWLGIQASLPCWNSVRTWLCRLGVDRLNNALRRYDDWIWMTDHSNQIGQEKVLSILGIRQKDLPPPGQTLRHRAVHVLAVVPGLHWKCEDVAQQYEALAAKIGMPKMVLTDGAVELRESVSGLNNGGKKPILLRDFKHYAANALEHQLGGCPRFKEFLSHLGSTRSSIQQTELSHFTPPSQKPKARFMNLGNTLRWAEMALWHLDHPQSKARQGITVERMQAKLGWLADYRAEIATWHRLVQAIDHALGFIHTQGLYQGAAEALREHLETLRPLDGVVCPAQTTMCRTLVEFVANSEQQLAPGERGWLSTELLESAFGLYKGLECQHSKGGFTSLLASFAALVGPCDAEEIRAAFARTSVGDMQTWVRENLGQTLMSKKVVAYQKQLAPACG